MVGLRDNQFYVRARRPNDYDEGTFKQTTFDTSVSAVFSDLCDNKNQQGAIQWKLTSQWT